MEERVCASCHRTFFVTEDTVCFVTCFKCRRPDTKQHKARVFPVNNGIGTAGVWHEGNNEWDDAVRLIENG